MQPTRDQVKEKYLWLLEQREYFANCTAEQRAAKEAQALAYFEAHVDALEREPPVTLAQAPADVTDEKREEAAQHKARGNALFAERNYAAALCEYSRAIECDPFNAVFFSNRAACYYSLKNYELCVQDCQRCVELAPDFGKAHARMANAYKMMGETQKARDAITKALELDPANTSYAEILHELDPAAQPPAPEAQTPPPQQQPPQPQPQPQPQQQAPNFLEGIMNNPMFAQMAQSMMNNPQMMDMARNMMSNPQMMNMARNMMGGMDLSSLAGMFGGAQQPPAQGDGQGSAPAPSA